MKRNEVGNECFENVCEFVIDGLENLYSVQTSNCYVRISLEKRDDGVYRITSCPNLRQLEIGYESFANFKSFELSNLNAIQSIKCGWRCFKYADCSLKGEWKERRNEMWFEWKVKMMF